MIPDFSGLFWTFIIIGEGILFAGAFSLFVFWFMPPIARAMIKAKWSRGVPAFIQNERGSVEFMTSDKELPEGVVHYKKRGWFLIPKKPYLRELIEKEKNSKPKRGRPLKEKNNPGELTVKELMKKFEKHLHTPILKGLNKQVFFGSMDSVALSNLYTISHANLRDVRLLAPIMYQKTQLDALATGNRLEGMKMMGHDYIKIVIIAIAVIGVIVTAGLVFWFLKG